MGRLGDPIPAIAAALWALPLTGVVIGAIEWAALHVSLAVGVAAHAAAGPAPRALALVAGGRHHDARADPAAGLKAGPIGTTISRS